MQKQQSKNRATRVGTAAGAVMAAIALALPAGALAADIAVMPAKAPSAPVAAPVYDWTGFYAGGHFGYGWGRLHSTNIGGGGAFPDGTVAETNMRGWIGGFQGGFNVQIDRFVLGIEGEYSWSGIKGTNSAAGLNPNFFQTTENRIKSLATVAGRLGIAIDNWLVYGKGGAAWGRFEGNTTVTNLGDLFALLSGGETRTGWLAGAGVEWGFAPNWSAKVEYDYLDFGTARIQRQFDFGGMTPTAERDVKAHLHLVKFGVNYRFNWNRPVTARY